MAGRNGKPESRRMADLETIAGNLLEAMAMLEVAIRAMGADDDGGPEIVVLERTLRELGNVQTDLDRHVVIEA
jgi:hypothetical protein